MASERRAERAKLEPAHEEFSGKLARWHKSTDVGAPVGHAVEPGVDAFHDLRLERLPCGVRVAGPQPAPALDTRVAVAVQRKRAAVRARLASALPVHAIAHQP